MAAIPSAAVADQGHTAGAGGPQAELHPGHSVLNPWVGAHPSPNVVMVSLGEQVTIHFPHPFLAKGVRVVLFVGYPSPTDAHPIFAARVFRQGVFKQPGVVGGFHGQLLAMEEQLHLVGIGHPNPHHPTALGLGLGTEHRIGMVVVAAGQPFGIATHPIKAGHHHRSDH